MMFISLLIVILTMAYSAPLYQQKTCITFFYPVVTEKIKHPQPVKFFNSYLARFEVNRSEFLKV